MSSANFGQSGIVTGNTDMRIVSLSLATIIARDLREWEWWFTCHNLSPLPRAPAKFESRSDSLPNSQPFPPRPAALHPLLLWTWWDKKGRREREVLMLQSVLQHSEKEREVKSTQRRAKELSLTFTSSKSGLHFLVSSKTQELMIKLSSIKLESFLVEIV